MAKTIFITGCSTGLGKSAALLFAKRDWKVIATMRTPDQGSELARFPNISVLALDVTNRDQILRASEQAIASGPIDVVFNNAGYGLVGPLEGATDEQLIRQFETNVLGVIRTTQAFLTHFREKQSGTFIITSSIGGLSTTPFGSTYHATKWALEGWAESLSYELNPFGIAIKTVSPGVIETDFFGRSLVATSHPAYLPLVKKVRAARADPARVATQSTADQIAEVVWQAATDGKDQLRYLAGEDAKATFARRVELGPEMFRQTMRKEHFG